MSAYFAVYEHRQGAHSEDGALPSPDRLVSNVQAREELWKEGAKGGQQRVEQEAQHPEARDRVELSGAKPDGDDDGGEAGQPDAELSEDVEGLRPHYFCHLVPPNGEARHLRRSPVWLLR